MRKIILITAILFLNATINFAQTNRTLDVNGLIINQTYTDTQMRVALGQPTRYDTWADEMGQGREYQYGNINDYSLFRYQPGHGGFTEFRLISPQFSIFNGLIKTGDNISKFSQLGDGVIANKGGGQYHFTLPGWDDPLIINVNSNNTITSLSYSGSV